MVRIQYLNNLVEQDHRFFERRVRPILRFKSFNSAASTIAGIEPVNVIRKGRVRPELRPFSAFLSDCHLKLRQLSTPYVPTHNLRRNQNGSSPKEPKGLRAVVVTSMSGYDS